jgi:general secretion pathway protein A
MYEQYFGLTKNPFSMTPDPSMLYVSPGHREALAGLAFALLEKKGLVVLTGEVGTGKTTLLARTLQCIPAQRMVSSVILNPTLTESEFFELMLLDFGFSDVPQSKARRLIRLQEFLMGAQKEGKIAALVVDEAHKLSPNVLEEIRLLSNMELPGEKLLQIVLAGQPELVHLLRRPDLRQLNQRISVRVSLQFLTLPEVEQYIGLRWSRSGTGPLPFLPETYTEIAHYSRGIPRVINAICDNSLLAAFAARQSKVGVHHIREACQDLWIIGKDAPPVNGHKTESPFRNELAATQPQPEAPRAPIRILTAYAEDNPSRWSKWMARLRPAHLEKT